MRRPYQSRLSPELLDAMAHGARQLEEWAAEARRRAGFEAVRVVSADGDTAPLTPEDYADYEAWLSRLEDEDSPFD